MGLNHIVLILLGLTALWFFVRQGMLVSELKAKLKAREESRTKLEKKILEAAQKNGGSITLFEAVRFTGEEESALGAALESLTEHHEVKKETGADEAVFYRITPMGS